MTICSTFISPVPSTNKVPAYKHLYNVIFCKGTSTKSVTNTQLTPWIRHNNLQPYNHLHSIRGHDYFPLVPISFQNMEFEWYDSKFHC